MPQPLRRRKGVSLSFWLRSTLPALALGLGLTASPLLAEEGQVPFDAWLEGVRSEAAARGIGNDTLEAALKDLKPAKRVLELDRRQPEFTQNFWRYLGNAVNDKRIAKGRRLMAMHKDLLDEVYQKYGVPPRYLVAFWGLETDFGRTFGSFPVITSLATLAHDPRRSAFFRGELMTALEILDAGHITPDRMEGSWAGAMGHLQFMPSTFKAYAVDRDGDGRMDIWGSLPDVFSSAANYLSTIGWKRGELWGREVQLPVSFDLMQVSLRTSPEITKTVSEWSALGVTKPDGLPLPQSDIKGALVLPAGDGGPAFLVYDNFRRILNWNRSTFYALAIGVLSDRLVGRPELAVTAPPVQERLSLEQVKEIQNHLNRLGFEAGPADGWAGSNTRTAIRAFQVQNDMPADGYPDLTLLKILLAKKN